MFKKVKDVWGKIIDRFKPKQKHSLVESLSATEDPEAYEIVSRALSDALEKKCINIGLVGPYGSGKSSAIKTFLSKHRNIKKKTLFVSFGDYLKDSMQIVESNKDVQAVEVNGQVEQTVLSGASDLGKERPAASQRFTKEMVERSVLEQILFSGNPNKTKESRIRRAGSTGKIRHPLKLAFGILLLVLSIVCALIWLDYWPRFMVFAEFDFGKVPTLLQAAAFTCPISMIIGTLLLIFNAGVLHFKINDLELDCGGPNDKQCDSILDKYFDEIVYCCRSNGIRMIVCEDLDRLGSLARGLFVDLRHLCVCLNESYGIKNEKPLTFVYCTNDVAFTENGEMQKFFDCIIPIRPVLNSANRLSVVKKKLENIEGFEECAKDDMLLSIFAEYVTDMRVLVSTINEFNLLVSRLNFVSDEMSKSNEKRKKQLILMCLYHNLHPDKYEELFTDRSEFLAIKSCGEAAMEKKKKELEVERNSLLKKGDKNKLIPLSSAQVDAISEAIMNGKHTFINDEVSTRKRLIENGYVGSLKEGTSNLFTSWGGGGYLKATVDDVGKYLKTNLYEWIEKPFRNKQESNRIRAKELQDEIDSFKGPLEFAISNPDETFAICNVTSLMKAMVVQGYFDETTIDGLLSDDVGNADGTASYVRRAVIEKNGDLTLAPLTNVNFIINDIDKDFFSKPEIINADIIEFFLQNPRVSNDSFSDKRKKMMTLLRSSEQPVLERKKRLIFASFDNHKKLIEKMLSDSKDALQPYLEKELTEADKQNAQKIVTFSAKEQRYRQNNLADVIKRSWNTPIKANDVKSLLKIKDDFEESGFKYEDIEFAADEAEIMRFITTTKSWRVSENNLILILGCDEDDDLAVEMEKRCRDKKWCDENGVDGEKVIAYVRESQFFSANKTPRKRSSINFSDLGIKVGAKITLLPVRNAVITVADNNHVRYEGKDYSLSGLKRELCHERGMHVLDRYEYKGKTLAQLQEMRAMTKTLEEFIELLESGTKTLG